MVSFMMTMKRRKVENDTNRFIIIINPSKTCLCDDIVSTILLKLPVESIIRFTSVSKSWNSLIRSPTFIATYNNLIRRRYLLYAPNKRCRALPPFVTSTDDEERRSNIKMPHDSYRVVGSCKGLVCVEDINNSQVYLWNPLLRTYQTIPPSPSKETTTTAHSYNVFGLGYSRNNNDYKIVKIIYSTKFSVEDNNKVEIYSMKFNSWKSIDSAEVPSIALEGIGVYIKGCVRWIGLTMSPTRPFIKNMWFDIDKESFGETDFPSQGLRLKYLKEPADQWPQSADVKELLRSVDCEDQYHPSKSCSLWKTKALACENSHVLLQLNWRDQLQVKHVKIFDGEILFRTECKNMINFLGANAVTPLEKKDVRMSEFFHVVCVSESLMLLGHRDE